VDLLWRAAHAHLALTLDPHQPVPASCAEGVTAGVDLGEVHGAAIVTEPGQGLVLAGRRLRSYKRLRTTRPAASTARMDRCKRGSRRWKRLARRKAQASAKWYRQPRTFLHQASCKLVCFAPTQRVKRLASGGCARRVGWGGSWSAVAPEHQSVVPRAVCLGGGRYRGPGGGRQRTAPRSVFHAHVQRVWAWARHGTTGTGVALYPSWRLCTAEPRWQWCGQELFACRSCSLCPGADAPPDVATADRRSAPTQA
jgi:hypothetical protein